MSQILSYLPNLNLGKGGTSHLDDDVIDRCNHRATVSLFIVLSVMISTLQHFGDPMHCWVPGHFTGNYEKYTDHICWVSNTYHLPPPGESIPMEKPEDQQINYYQWVSLFLILQAMFFFTPCLLWRVFYPNSGVDLNGIVTTASTVTSFEKGNEHRRKCVEYIVQQIDRYLDHYQDNPALCCKHAQGPLAMGKRHGNFLVIYYSTIKVLYLGNALVQLFILNWFLSANFHAYGFEIIGSWIRNTNFPPSKLFPRSTLCTFSVHALGNEHRHTVQCVLPINFYNEKLYLIVWLWLMLIIVLNAGSLFIWAYRFAFPYQNLFFIRHYLRSTKRILTSTGRDNKVARHFVDAFLRQDGVFILRMMKANVNGLIVSEVTKELFELYEIKNKPFMVNGDTADSTQV